MFTPAQQLFMQRAIEKLAHMLTSTVSEYRLYSFLDEVPIMKFTFTRYFSAVEGEQNKQDVLFLENLLVYPEGSNCFIELLERIQLLAVGFNVDYVIVPDVKTVRTEELLAEQGFRAGTNQDGSQVWCKKLHNHRNIAETGKLPKLRYPVLQPGQRLQFRTGDSIIEYLGPGWGDLTFAGVIVETTHTCHKVGDKGVDWARSAWVPITTNFPQEATAD